MAYSSKSKKDLIKKELLQDPYKEVSLADLMSDEDPDSAAQAFRETKNERERQKARFEKIKKRMLGE